MMLAKSYDEWYRMPVGTYMWVDTIVNMKPLPTLIIKLPDVRNGNPFGVVARLFPRRTKGDWGSGSIMSWDGNVDEPTLHGSIWFDKPHGWHGHLIAGRLVDA